MEQLLKTSSAYRSTGSHREGQAYGEGDAKTSQCPKREESPGAVLYLTYLRNLLRKNLACLARYDVITR